MVIPATEGRQDVIASTLDFSGIRLRNATMAR
jgi:hypothetical protein